MEDLSFDAACAFLDTVMIPNSRTGSAIARITAEVALCRESLRTLAECAHDLLVLLDEADVPVTEDGPLSLAIEQLDHLVHRVRAVPGGAGAALAAETITQVITR